LGSCLRFSSPPDASLDDILLGNALENQNFGYADFQLGSNTEFDWLSASIFHGAGDFTTPSAEYDLEDWNGREARAASFGVVFAGSGGIGF
jgi:hypothetical protein